MAQPDQADRFSKQEQGGGVRHASTPATTDRRSGRQLIPGDKGNLALLRGTDGKLKRAVTLEIARRFGGVTLRAIQDAAKNGKLRTEGVRQQRRVLVESLLRYFPPEK